MRSTAESPLRPPSLRRPIAFLLLLGSIAVIPAVAQEAQHDEQSSYRISPPFAWNREDRYEAPNFEAFFPVEEEAGRRLDAMLAGQLKIDSVDDRLELVRRGLRTMTRHRTTLLGQVGNKYIWNVENQDPRAVELLYQASDSPDREVAHYALYHGPTVVSSRTPNLLRMLMSKYQSLDDGMQQRIIWGMKTYGDREQTRQLFLDLVEDHEELGDGTVAAALDTYRAVFDEEVPDIARFNETGKWVIAFHRDDLSASHPRAAEILREELSHISLRNGNLQLIDFVTRVDEGHETAVVVVQGSRSRSLLIRFLSDRLYHHLDFNELLSARVLRERRLRGFARHLPDGLPKGALPDYTRPPQEQSYAYCAEEFVAPDFEAFFADNAEAGEELDHVYLNRDEISLSDRELLELFRRGVRRSKNSPNSMFGWISGALGWPRDPLLTEILYQGMDPDAPEQVRKAANYYGFGLGSEKTKNILEAKFRLYMAPPFDRTTNGNMRRRILWGLGVHEDDRHFLATRFAEALQNHESLSIEALIQADQAYRQLTEMNPPNVSAYAERGFFIIALTDRASFRTQESKRHAEGLLANSRYVADWQFYEADGQASCLAVVRGIAGKDWLIQELESHSDLSPIFAELLNQELIDGARNDAFKQFESLLEE